MIALLILVVVLTIALVIGLGRRGWSASGRDLRPYLVAIGIFWIAPLVLMLVLHLVLPDHNPNGQCEGIGFGCVPAPSDGVVILWALTLPFTFTAGLIACAVIAAVRRGRRTREAQLAAGRGHSPM